MATLATHAVIKKRADYQDLLRKRIFRIPLPNANSELARRCTQYSNPSTYNKVNRICDLRDCTHNMCKKKITAALLKLTYIETEALL
ncbi:hypothetical protein B5X24_HaOG210638 [Helicoverpa armigera]|nr:hypothetical protein B5X24_HaOG210638 [Helicoverpa armigera]